MDRKELLAKMEAGRNRLEEALKRVGPERMETIMVYPTWSAKDLLSHLGFWEGRVAERYQALAQGSNPHPEDEGLNFDALNLRNYEKTHDLPLDTVTHSEQAAYQKVVALVESVPETDLFNPTRFAWTNGTPFAEWIIGNTYGHIDEHLPDLLSKIE
jgi:hypothetical protein